MTGKKAGGWLCIDIGNTHTVAGIYDGQSFRSRVRFRTDPHATADEYRLLLSQLIGPDWPSLQRVIVTTVVPSMEAIVERACDPVPTLFVRWDTRREFELDLPSPQQLGADRLANVAGALTLAKPPFLIVDGGTATTFCLIDARPAYIGGSIVPGMEISWKALQSRAAKLYSVQLDRPEDPIGRTTETQLQGGVIQGYESLIEGMTDRLLEAACRRDPSFADAQLFATGGCIQPLRLSSRFRIEPDLTLLGLVRYGQLTE